MSDVFEGKTVMQQFFFTHLAHALIVGEQLFQYAPVFSQGIVDVPYMIVTNSIKLVIVIVAAIIVAELFV
jgi:hypothetical protein